MLFGTVGTIAAFMCAGFFGGRFGASAFFALGFCTLGRTADRPFDAGAVRRRLLGWTLALGFAFALACGAARGPARASYWTAPIASTTATVTSPFRTDFPELQATLHPAVCVPRTAVGIHRDSHPRPVAG